MAHSEQWEEIKRSKLGMVRVVSNSKENKLQLLRSNDKWVDANQKEIESLTRSAMYGEFINEFLAKKSSLKD